MLGLFKRAQPVVDAGDLGHGLVALPVRTGCTPPAGCAVVVVGAGGHTRRGVPGKKIELRDGELAWTYHPGPYTVDLAPFAQAAEIGLRTSFAIDLDAGGERHRFDLLLAAEAQGALHLATLTRALEEALQRALAQGALALPPCTTIDEWNAFRQGLNQLCWMRFGLTVDDCVPVDLGETRDFAEVLAARAAQASAQAESGAAARIEPQLGDMKAALAPDAQAASSPADGDPAVPDARALRRLFLELPGLMCGLRMAALPSDQDQFRRQQALLQRLDLLSVAVSTMPALELAAPGQPLADGEQQRRARHSQRACVSLDEAWALLGRFNALDGSGAESVQPGADALARLYDEAERIVANLELDAGARRGIQAEAEGGEA